MRETWSPIVRELIDVGNASEETCEQFFALKVREASDVHPENAEAPIDVTDSGMASD